MGRSLEFCHDLRSSTYTWRDCSRVCGTNNSCHRNRICRPRDTMGRYSCMLMLMLMLNGGKMSRDLERLRRQKVLKDLNSRLTAGTKAGLTITGHKIRIQGTSRIM